ncbi:zinc-binding dehydrogenase [Frankia sp. CiP3]|uniref:zinc-dependent alcohol dehydrogenase n=1 Tax=Frankia sp. CiP3 TaxID=2880971 RepID=UPI001EF3F18C|nr:zinc-binding dehydrogenase [Frankia sp. CiP3]
MSRALELYRSMPRYLATRTLSGRLPALAGAAAGMTAPLRLTDGPAPAVPGEGWVPIRPRLSGICGSDLATVTGQLSLYFTSLVSMPFVPGHEIVADTQTSVTLTDGTELPAGSRVVLDPVLGCAARGLPACAGCAAGHTSRCDNITVGHLSPGLQTGFCARTGGGWSRSLVAHRSQLYPVPADLPDERAVLVEPLACAVHTALRARAGDGDRILIIGAGSVGLFTLLALRAYTKAGLVTVVAKHRHQVERARLFGADEIISPASAVGGVRRATRALKLEPEAGPPYLLGGVDIAIDCAGSASSLSTALRVTRAGGRVVLSGVPTGPVDLTPLWFRELELVGTYASSAGRGLPADGAAGAAVAPADFVRALELAATAPLDGVVSAAYPLDRWRDALDHALGAGRLGAVKVAFDLMAT